MKNVSFFTAIAMSIFFLLQSCSISYTPKAFVKSNKPSRVKRIALIYKTDSNHRKMMDEFVKEFRRQVQQRKNIHTQQFSSGRAKIEKIEKLDFNYPSYLGLNYVNYHKIIYNTNEKGKEILTNEALITAYQPNLRVKLAIKHSSKSFSTGYTYAPNLLYPIVPNSQYSKNATFNIHISNLGKVVYKSTFNTKSTAQRNPVEAGKSLARKLIRDLKVKGII